MANTKDCKLKENQEAKSFLKNESDGSLFYACQSIVEHNNNVWFWTMVVITK